MELGRLVKVNNEGYRDGEMGVILSSIKSKKSLSPCYVVGFETVSLGHNGYTDVFYQEELIFINDNPFLVKAVNLKEGDKVIIKKGLKDIQLALDKENIKSCGVVEDMIKYENRIATIVSVDKDEDFLLDIDNKDWYWSPYFLEKVEPIKVGDEVRIRDDIQEGQMLGSCRVVYDMLKYRGAIGKVVRIDEDGDYVLDVDGRTFFWSSFCLEKIS